MQFLFLLFLLFIRNCICYININIDSTGLYIPYTLGSLAYIKKYGNINNYHITGISGGSFASIIYYLEDDLTDHDKLWKIFVGKDDDCNIIVGKNLDKFQKSLKNNLLNRYRNISDTIIKNAPISIIVSKINNNIIQNEKINNFDNLEDLLNYCICSSYIPFISGGTLTYNYKNTDYFDGCILKDDSHFLCKDKCDYNIYIHKKIWNRKFNFLNYFYLNKNISKNLFEYGWNDTKKNFKLH